MQHPSQPGAREGRRRHRHAFLVLVACLAALTVLLVGPLPGAGAVSRALVERAAVSVRPAPAEPLRAPQAPFGPGFAPRSRTVPGVLAPSLLGAGVPAGNGHWTWQRQLPQGGTLCDVATVDGQEAWACGDDGTMLHTVDGGVTWQRQASDSRDMLTALHFIDDQRGWAVGYEGDVVQTENGGVDWECIAGLPDDALLAVWFTDAAHGFVSTAWGAIYGSEDAGRSWELVWSADELGFDGDAWVDISAIAFSDTQHGWAAGSAWVETREGASWNAVLLHTTDGGATWQSVADPGMWPLSSVSATGGTVLATDWWGGVYRSTDQGAHWSSSTPVSGLGLASVLLLADGRAWAVGESGLLLASADDGVTWSEADVRAAGVQDLFAVAVGSGGGMAVGADGVMLRSVDLHTWVDGSQTAHDYLWDVTAADPLHAWCVGGRPDGTGFVLSTEDGGETWQDAAAPQPGGLFAIDAAPDGSVWAVGRGGTVLRWSQADGWSRSSVRTSASLYDVTLTDDGHAFIEGAGVLLASDDGGLTWSRRTCIMGNGEEPYDYSFVDGDHGWAVGMEWVWEGRDEGEYGFVYSTSDGGVTWQREVRLPKLLYSVCFVDGLNGWAVGGISDWEDEYAGCVYVTTDGGHTWVEQPAPGDGLQGFYDVCFVDGQNGWTVGYSDWDDTATVLRTVDGGAHWGVVRTGAGVTPSWVTVRFLDAAHGWVVTDEGGILATTDGGGIEPGVSDDNRRFAYNRPVVIGLQAHDDGLGIDRVEYRVNGGSWTVGDDVAFPARRDHSDDGTYMVQYRAVDGAGNQSAAHSTWVYIDTRKPRVKAPWPVRTGRHSGIRVRFRLQEEMFPWVECRVVVRDARGRVTYRGPWEEHEITTHMASQRLRHRFASGSYRFSVYVRDWAGNHQFRVASNRLVVR